MVVRTSRLLLRSYSPLELKYPLILRIDIDQRKLHGARAPISPPGKSIYKTSMYVYDLRNCVVCRRTRLPACLYGAAESKLLTVPTSKEVPLKRTPLALFILGFGKHTFLVEIGEQKENTLKSCNMKFVTSKLKLNGVFKTSS